MDPTFADDLELAASTVESAARRRSERPSGGEGTR